MPLSRKKSKSRSSRNTTLSATSSLTSLHQNHSKPKTSRKKKRSGRDAVGGNGSEGSVLDSAADSDYELWEPSTSPEEDWDAYSNPNSDDEWLVEGITKEEVTNDGVTYYEVKWGGGWRRPDGTSTTWQKDIDGGNNMKSRWTREQTKRREKLARESLDVNITKLASAYAHDYRTQEWDDAVWEKYNRAVNEEENRIAVNSGSSIVDWDGEVQRHKEELWRQINENRDQLINRSRGGRGAAISRIHSELARRLQEERMERRNRNNKRRQASPSIDSIAPQSDATEPNDEREDENEVDGQMQVDASKAETEPARSTHEEIRSRLRQRPNIVLSTTSNSLPSGLRKTEETSSRQTIRDRSISLGREHKVMAGRNDRQRDELGRYSNNGSQVTVKQENDDKTGTLVSRTGSTNDTQKDPVKKHTTKKIKKEPSERMVCVDVPPMPVLSQPRRKRTKHSSFTSTRDQGAGTSLESLGDHRLHDLGNQETSNYNINASSYASTSAPSSSRIREDSPYAFQYRKIHHLSVHPRPSSSKQPHTITRANLESQWNECAREVGAKSIRIINDLSDDDNGAGREEFPPVCNDFIYLEKQYIYTEETDPLSKGDFLIGCECMKCDDPSQCACQESSDVKDAEGVKLLSYNRRGRFLFNNEGSEVIECNSKCKCPPTCINRVAQRSRDIVVEIFKTRRNGWGARATELLPRGKVLGLYTGKIIRREDADKTAKGKNNYIFDLDTRDADLSAIEYSINAEFAGNWTRFINHSCEPVASVYPVVIETPLELNVPCLAIVAKVDIPAHKEITIDYSPDEPRGVPGLVNGRGGVGWMPVIIPNDRERCFCGSDHCRGYI